MGTIIICNSPFLSGDRLEFQAKSVGCCRCSWDSKLGDLKNPINMSETRKTLL